MRRPEKEDRAHVASGVPLTVWHIQDLCSAMHEHHKHGVRLSKRVPALIRDGLLTPDIELTAAGRTAYASWLVATYSDARPHADLTWVREYLSPGVLA